MSRRDEEKTVKARVPSQLDPEPERIEENALKTMQRAFSTGEELSRAYEVALKGAAGLQQEHTTVEMPTAEKPKKDFPLAGKAMSVSELKRELARLDGEHKSVAAQLQARAEQAKALARKNRELVEDTRRREVDLHKRRVALDERSAELGVVSREYARAQLHLRCERSAREAVKILAQHCILPEKLGAFEKSMLQLAREVAMRERAVELMRDPENHRGPPLFGKLRKDSNGDLVLDPVLSKEGQALERAGRRVSRTMPVNPFAKTHVREDPGRADSDHERSRGTDREPSGFGHGRGR